MDTPLLSTKLFVPQPRPGLILRPRLLERLNAALGYGLVIVSAPAGFGKTTVVSQWAQQSETPLAWVSLDTGDNDPVRFWDYVIAALKTFKPAAGDAASSVLHSGQSYTIEAVLTSLINDVVDISRDFAVVLDDYHLIKSDAIHAGIAFLLDNMPPGMHLVIATRSDPPLPLPHFRGRGALVEVSGDDLRFTDVETAMLLKELLGVSLAAEDVVSLNVHTEGWVVGLKMAALSMRGERDLRAFISGFTGSQRYVMDYLVEEVLKRQTEEVRDFLLKTSVLERMTAPLCEFLTGGNGGRDMLVELDRANLFLVPLDETRQWYRYHHLFAELLRHQLKVASGVAGVVALHQQAGQWYEAQGSVDDAIHHALAARDWEMGLKLIGAESESRLKRGEWGTLLNWFQMIPDEALRTNTMLYSRYAHVLIMHGQLDPAEAVLGHLEGTDWADGRLQGEVAYLQTSLARMRGNVPRAAEMARRALALLPQDSVVLRARASFLLSIFEMMMLNIEEARLLASDAFELGRQAGDLWTCASGAGWLSYALFLQGKPRAALEAAHHGVELAGQSPAAAQILGILARFLYEYNELDDAAECAQRASELTELTGHAEMRAYVSQWLALERLTRGDVAGSLAWAEKAGKASRHGTVAPLGGRRIYEAWRVMFAILRDDLEGAIYWGDRLSKYSDDLVQDPLFLYVPARLLIARGQKAAAAETLRDLCSRAIHAGAYGLVVQIRVCQALAAATPEEALTFLVDALKKGEPAGFIRTFVDEGKLLAPILREALARGIVPEYTARLLNIIESEEGMRQARRGAGSTRVPSKILSDRELEILRLVAAGLSNGKIADRLVISPGTVKRHVHNVFEKLDAGDRLHAVNRARELKLI